MADTHQEFENKIIAELQAMNLPSKVLIALSGGRDSMVLAHLCLRVKTTTGTQFIAATVDHGLRAQAAQEAICVKGWCEAIGLEHVVLTPDDCLKIETGIQEQARNLRYGLLIKTAYEHGCDAILTAHSQTDLAETVLMRLARGSGTVGLSGMARQRLVARNAGPPIRLIRPLLSGSREIITAYANENEITYLDDPSNNNPAYERVRYRALIAALEEQGILSEKAVARTANRLEKSSHRVRTQRRQDFKDAGGLFCGWGAIQFARPRLAVEDHAPMLAQAIHAVGGGDYAPREEASLECVEKVLQTGAATLSGTLVISDQEKLTICREPAALRGRGRVPARLSLDPGARGVWDRRLVFQNNSPRHALLVDSAANSGEMHTTIAVPAGCSSKYLDSFAYLSWQNGALFTPAFPAFLPYHVSMKSLLPERFDGNVIRYYA